MIRRPSLARATLPAILQFEPNIVGVAPAQLADGICNPEMNGLNGCNQVGRHRPVSTYLCVGASPCRAMASSARDDSTSLLINGVVRAHPPLESNGKQQG